MMPCPKKDFSNQAQRRESPAKSGDFSYVSAGFLYSHLPLNLAKLVFNHSIRADGKNPITHRAFNQP
jgi:hypothetical protein